MLSKIEPMVRINSRVRKDQHKFIKDHAKKARKTEGEMHRDVIDYYIKNHK